MNGYCYSTASKESKGGPPAGTPHRSPAHFMLSADMFRKQLPIGSREIALIVCTVALVALVYSEGWTWPLKAAAVMIPISLLIG